ncbi:MAG TPA: VOC family protein [Kiritimatiellia bacterium]|nr:VOC family protein [Kiritimatiellia bacterium]
MNSVHHIAFNCRDRAAQEAFYTRHFGFQRARVFNADTPDEFVMLRLGATCLELFQAKPDAAAHRGSEQAVGFKHLPFEVPDIEAAVRGLTADGIHVDKIIDCGALLPGLKVCFFNDPEGNRLELMQGWRDQS